LVDNVIMPPVGMLMGGVDFSQLFFNLGDKEFATMEALDKAGAPAIKYGQFIQDTISFIILGFVLFMMIKAYNKLKKAEPEEAPATPAEEVLLGEIRDLLKK
ncbi:MAG TPA: large conductance mechanosensitive channel protein MscL, partial [Sulfurimonas sp.]|nr:large conductance mechanosensitive channel protein MscL [Sulfurimonas sp.]